MTMTLGAIAELKVSDYRVMHDEVMHSVPHKMMVERMKIEMGGK